MSNRLSSPRPWQAWLAVLVGAYCCYLLYAQFLGLRVYFRSDIVTNKEQFAEHLLRMSGVFILACAALLGWLRRPFAFWVAVSGALTYLLPWFYGYASSVAAQPQSHLKWHMLKVYPVLSWQWLVFPCLGALLVYIVARENRVKPSGGGR
jgi:hypothetical protein